MEKTTKKNSVFKSLAAIDCRDKTEKKNGLTVHGFAKRWTLKNKCSIKNKR